MNATIELPVQLSVPIIGEDLVRRTIGTLRLDITGGAIEEHHLRERLGELLLEAGRSLTVHGDYPDTTDDASLTMDGAVVPIAYTMG